MSLKALLRNPIKRDTEHASALYFPTKAQRIMLQCGVRMAALYLRNRGYTAEQAVTILFR